MTLSALGDSAVVIALGEGIDEQVLARVRALTAALEQDRLPGVVDVVPAYATVTVFYDPAEVAATGERPFERISRLVTERAGRIEADAKKKFSSPGRTVEIPVVYGGEFGPDLEAVARHCGMETGEVIKRHQAGDYLVHAIGFVPGFCYLGGLAPALHVPRHATPRPSVAAGSVGIGGAQTGVYPLVTPGGWNLIGRTPLALFRPNDPEPARLRVGDRVKFRAISREEFGQWK